MPELPEVQTVVNDLQTAAIVGANISGARAFWPRTIHGWSPQQFSALVTGRQIQGLHRRGKFIVFRLDAGWHLLVHLRMTGRLVLAERDSPRTKHQHVILELDDLRHLRFFDPRKFGRIYLTRTLGQIVGKLGPEPLAKTFTARRLARMTAATRRMLKPLLLDQGFVAGLGNIYVDEALWEAGLHPQRRAASLSWQENRRLHRAIRRVLRRGLRNLGTTLGSGQTTFYSVGRHRGRNRDALQVFRRTGLPCPRCSTAIARISVGQRSTHICPLCQPD